MPPLQRNKRKRRGGSKSTANNYDTKNVGDDVVEPEVENNEDEEEQQENTKKSRRSSQSSQQRLSKATRQSSSARGSVKGAVELDEVPRFDNKQHRSKTPGDAICENEPYLSNYGVQVVEVESHNEHTRVTVADSRQQSTNVVGGLKRRDDAPPGVSEEFFHDVRSMQPLQVSIGVCPLPSSSSSLLCAEKMSFSTTSLLLSARKFFTLPEDKGGADVVGWTLASSGVSLELPGEGAYNTASVSLSVMLPP